MEDDSAGNTKETERMGAVEILEGIIEHMGFDAYVAEVKRSEDGQELHLEVKGPDSGRLIGQKGQTLEALQLLLSRMIEKGPGENRRVFVDVEGYRQRRDSYLASMAERMAEEAVTLGCKVRLDPMDARERRVIHMTLSSRKGIATVSEGEGMDRHVCIVPENLSHSES